MKATLIYPGRRFYCDEYFPPKDFFWVEVPDEEMDQMEGKFTIPRHPPAEVLHWRSEWFPHNYFLVATDLSCIEKFPWSFPFSPMWNGYCPFRGIEEFEIREVEELLNHDYKIIHQDQEHELEGDRP